MAGDKELKRAICGVASVQCTKTGAASSVIAAYR